MIDERLKKAILNALDLDDWELSDDTTASEVPGWDSLSHVRVISAVESEYKIRFSTKEVIRLRSVGDLQNLVNQKSE